MAQALTPDDTQPVMPLEDDSMPPFEPGGGANLVRWELKVEALERRLRARTLEFETELRGKQRLRARIEELTQRVCELQETASVLHREAVSSTMLSRELDAALRAASEAAAPELKKRDAELREVRRQLQSARQKTDGHEAHIDSLRAELAGARELQAPGDQSSSSETPPLAAPKDLVATPMARQLWVAFGASVVVALAAAALFFRG